MSRVILASLRRRSGRALALLLGMLVATTGFTVLTGSTETARLRVTGTVAEHFRGAYDILVRPAGARTELEEQRQLVRPNFLSGGYGGIGLDQWRAIEEIPGVEVAAPIGMLGYGYTDTSVAVDITDAVDRSATRQLIEVRPVWLADRGLTEAAMDHVGFVYVTTRPVAWPTGPVALATSASEIEYTDGVRRPASTPCGGGWVHFGLPYEIQEDGTDLRICPTRPLPGGSGPEILPVPSEVAQRTADGTFLIDGEPADRLTVHVSTPMPQLVAAIDPVAEAALVGLDEAVVAGRYLAADEQALPWSSPTDIADANGLPMPPALVASEPLLDEQVTLVTHQVELGGVQIAGRSSAELLELTDPLPRQPVPGPDAPVSVGEGHRPELWDGEHAGSGLVISTQLYRQVDPVAYELTAAGELRPQTHPPAHQDWVTGSDLYQSAPWLSRDTAFRQLRSRTPAEVVGELDDPVVVGVFDRDRLTGVDPVVAVPLETYLPVSAEGGDEASRDLLGGRPLLPSSNPAGYLTTSPSVLIPLSTLPTAADRSLVSAVRVRVAGITGFDEVAMERVRVVAEDIAAATGLDVDIMLGSSGEPQQVVLPAGDFGRPELRLSELWSRKGVAAAIIAAVDRKSVVLFGLILVVCLLFAGNAVAAAVRDRRRELAMLACLGWPRWRLGATVAGEVVSVGLLAGVLGAVVAGPLGRAVGVAVPASRAWLAVPVAVGLAALAAAVPALRAARAHPGAAVHPAVRAPRRPGRSRRHRWVVGLAATNLVRVPGRTALGVLALAVGVGGLTLVAAVTWVFNGTVTGSLLGDAVSVRVRGVDAVAVAATVLLGLLAVADVLYLNVRERAAELAALRATGWSDAALGRLVTFEGLGMGLAGAVLGAGAGLAGAAWFAGALPAPLVATAAAVAAGGLALAGLAALVPAQLQRRIPMATLLAEE